MPASVRDQMAAAYRAKVQEKVASAVRLLALEAFRRVVARSPVDEGRFRGNWQLGVTDRPSGTASTLDDAPAGSPPSSAAMNAAVAETSKLNAGLGKVYVVNNLPYARRLEEGHSQTQAPDGMVEVTAQELRVAAKQIIQQALRA